MAITITQERKKQRYFILALAAIIFAILSVIWLGFLQAGRRVSEPSAPGTVYAVPKAEIDWQLLEDLRGKTLRPVEEISAFEGGFGRKNPFIPY